MMSFAATPGQRPRVSVLTAVHNGERFLDATIASVMAQTFVDFEYILVDDASQDSSPAILASWAARDGRIRLLHNARALNPAGALNRALAEACGEYVAILDHDDIAFSTRLAEEVAFLDANPTIGLVGGQVVMMDEAGKLGYRYLLPTLPALCRWIMLFQCPASHSTILARRAILEQVGGYSVHRWAAADYDLYHRVSNVTQMTNLPTLLGTWRRHTQQTSIVHSKTQFGQILLCTQGVWWNRFGLRPPLPALTRFLHAIYRMASPAHEEELLEAAALLDTLYRAFLATETLNELEALAVRQDVAWRTLWFAWSNRHLHRRASRKLIAHALELDPNLWANCWHRLRNYYRKDKWMAKQEGWAHLHAVVDPRQFTN